MFNLFWFSGFCNSFPFYEENIKFEDNRKLIASLGVSTIGSPGPLKEVFKTTEIPAIFFKCLETYNPPISFVTV